MKKSVFAFLLAAVMLLNAFPAQALESAVGRTPTHNHTGPAFVVETVSGKPGASADVTIRLENNPGITSIKLEVEYGSGLTLTGVTLNPELNDKFLTSELNRHPVILNWYDGMENVTGDWTFVTLHFQVAADAAQGTYSVTVNYDPNDVFDVNEDNVTFAIENGGIVVGSAVVPVTGVALNADSLSMAVGESRVLTARVSPENATNQKVTFTSSDASVASVDANGRVTALGTGAAVITVTTADGSKTDSCTVTVSCGHGSKTEVPAKAAGCQKPGNAMYFLCNDCGQAFKADGVTITTVEAETIPAAGHSYLAATVEPTCTEEGYTVYTCACGDSYMDSFTDALGHSFTGDHGGKVVCERCQAAGTQEDLTAQEDLDTQEDFSTQEDSGSREQIPFRLDILLLGILAVLLLALAAVIVRYAVRKKR